MAAKFKNPIVAQLWAWREKAKAEVTGMELPIPDGEPDAKTPSESHIEISYPFSTDPFIAEAYQNPWQDVRMGKIFEDLDAFAGNVAFKHVVGNPLIVTAGVDRIRLSHHPHMFGSEPPKDMKLSGRVTWVGKSSMEIRMQCEQGPKQEEWLEAYFTFVTLDPKTKRTIRVPPLRLETDDEREHYERGAVRAQSKKKVRQQKVQVGKPLTEEALNVDRLAATLLDEASPLIKLPSVADPKAILMNQTSLQNALIAQPQVRNLADRIFGGYLMRRAFELAFANAYMFGGSKPMFLEVDDISFLHPVRVGDLLVFHSRVLYTRPEGPTLGGIYDSILDHPSQPLIVVEVEVWITEPERAQARVSNTFHFTFALPRWTSCRKVLPSNIEEARRMAAHMINMEEAASG